MADDFTVDNGAGTDFKVKAKEAESSAYVQAVEIAQVSGATTTYLLKAEDAAHTTGDLGIMALGVRKDTAAATAGTDGDYMPVIFDSSGRLHVNVGAALAAARTSDTVSAALAVDKLMIGTTETTPVHVAVDVAASGDNTLVAAQGSGNKILVHQVFLAAASAVTVRFESGAGGTALTGQMQLSTSLGFVLPFSPVGWFKTAANTLLNLELSGAVSVDGVIAYSVVT